MVNIDFIMRVRELTRAPGEFLQTQQFYLLSEETDRTGRVALGPSVVREIHLERQEGI